MLRPPLPTREMSRRRFLRAGASTAFSAAVLSAWPRPTAAGRTSLPADSPPRVAAEPDFAALDATIRATMARHHIPGAAVGILYAGDEWVQGYGVTNVDYPLPVDGDSLFRIASTTKTFTGTAIMCLVERGILDLDAPVRRYLPDLRLADESVAARVTLRQLLNHSAGWFGDFDEDTGRGEDALARYVAQMAALPQVTPPGEVFAYNNTAVDLAGRVLEVVSDKPYEDVVQELVLDPLGLQHAFYFSDALVGYAVAAPHAVVDEQPDVRPEFWRMPRSANPDGGLIMSTGDLLRYARFHLGDGRAADGRPLLTPQSLAEMRTVHGPGGTIGVELAGVGVNWMLRATAEGPHVIQHGGSYPGQLSGFVLVPERGFALSVLTNADSGAQLINELTVNDGVLREFAGLSNPPAVPSRLAPTQLAPYLGEYVLPPVPTELVLPSEEVRVEVAAEDGRLRLRQTSGGVTAELRAAFYRPDYVVTLDDAGEPTPTRADFVRDATGRVAWLRSGGRLYAHQQ